MKKVSKKKLYIFGLGFAIVAVLSAGALAYIALSKNSRTVVLTEKGYVPQQLVINVGDTVTFRSEISEPFWPASNVHPTHSIYSAFDPKQPVSPEESWSFTFDKVGRWTYHDHINPVLTGQIVVRESDGTIPQVSSEACETLSGPGKMQCFETKLEEILSQDGMEAAFNYFIQIYNADPEVPSVCHGWAHRLGEVEYEDYKNGEEVSLRPEATFCSYGYFHGFINAMVEDTQSLESALAFCNTTLSTEKDGLQNLRNNCLHGIGHSITTLYLQNLDYWGDFEKVMRGGFYECDQLYGNSPDRVICYDGMFHELHLSIMQGAYGMSADAYTQTGDLFHYCRTLEDEYKESCYYDFITLWPNFFNNDKISAMEYVLATIERPEQQGWRAMRTFARSFIERDISKGEYAQSVEACEMVPHPLYDHCLGGLASGFAEHGAPGKAHEQGFAFCRDYFDAEKEGECIAAVIYALSWSYTRENMQRACLVLSEEQRPKKCSEYIQ